MGLLSGIASIATSGKRKRARERINREQQRMARVRNFQARRSFIRQFRDQQAQAVLAGFTSGQEGGSSAAMAEVSSLGSQARLLKTENRALEISSDRIGYNQRKLDKYNDIIGLAGATDALLGLRPFQQAAGNMASSSNSFISTTGNFIQDYFGS